MTTQEVIQSRELQSVVDDDLFRGSDEDLLAALAAGTICFHEGRIGGAWPTVRG